MLLIHSPSGSTATGVKGGGELSVSTIEMRKVEGEYSSNDGESEGLVENTSINKLNKTSSKEGVNKKENKKEEDAKCCCILS